MWSTRFDRVIACSLGHFSFGLIQLSHRSLSHSLNGDGPPEQTGLVTFSALIDTAVAEANKYSDIAADYNDAGSPVLQAKPGAVNLLNGGASLMMDVIVDLTSASRRFTPLVGSRQSRSKARRFGKSDRGIAPACCWSLLPTKICALRKH
jgi:hypothetical protein